MLAEILFLVGIIGYQIDDEVNAEARQVAGSRIGLLREVAAAPVVFETLLYAPSQAGGDGAADEVGQKIAAGCAQRVQELIHHDAFVSAAWIIDREGQVRCSTMPINRDHRWHSAWKNIVVERRPTHVNMVAELAELAGPGVQISVPVQHDGQRVGVAVLTIRLHRWALDEERRGGRVTFSESGEAPGQQAARDPCR